MLSFIPTAYATTIDPEEIGLPAIDTFGALVSDIWVAVLALAGILLFFYLIFGGFKYITAGGDDKAVQAAKKMLTNAVVGMIIVFATYWIVLIVEDVLGLTIF